MAKKLILCIDDDPETLQLVRLILAREPDFDFKSTTSGQQGIELTQRLKPDLVLLDIMMPDVDGWQVLEKIRALEETRNTRVVLFSAVGMITSTKVDGYISKPFSPQKLMSGIRRVLED
ncbi:MAG: response regulator [Anaerolineae bacterium]|nr:response regulator [Anaerolineae bacterium]